MWEEDQDFERTDAADIWLNKTDSKFYFSDETSLLEGNGPYATKEEAIAGLNKYAEWLNHGDV